MKIIKSALPVAALALATVVLGGGAFASVPVGPQSGFQGTHPVTGSGGGHFQGTHPVTGSGGGHFQGTHPVTGSGGGHFQGTHPVTGSGGGGHI